MKSLLIVLALVGCETPERVYETYDNSEMEHKVSTLEYQLDFEVYDRHMEKCFVAYDFCVLQKKQKCWDIHEGCVIATGMRWKIIKAQKGYK